jgi:hypothetical protein
MKINQIFDDKQYQIVTIFSGGFHLFTPGHLSVWNYLIDKFPNAKHYIASSNKTDNRPFSFKEKQFLASQAGIPKNKFIEVKKPYVALEILKQYNPNNTIVIFAISDKDKKRFGTGIKKDGSLSYLLPFSSSSSMIEPYKNHAYYIVVPAKSYTILNRQIKSANEVRQLYISSSEIGRFKIIEELYPNSLQVNKIKRILDKELLHKKINEGKFKKLVCYHCKGNGFIPIVKNGVKSGNFCKYCKGKGYITIKDTYTNLDEDKNTLIMNNQNKINNYLWYAGSHNYFSKFKNYKKAGVTSKIIKQPIFLSSNVNFAKYYAGNHGWIYKVHVNLSNTFDGNMLLNYNERYYLDPKTYTSLGKKVYNDIVNNKIWNDGNKDPEGYIKALANRQWDTLGSPEFITWLKSKGYDSYLEEGEGDLNLGVFDANKLEILKSFSINHLNEDQINTQSNITPVIKQYNKKNDNLTINDIIELFKIKYPNIIKYGNIRDNCGVVAAEFEEFAEKNGFYAPRVFGTFTLDKIDLNIKNFYKSELLDMQREGLNSHNKEDRLAYVKQHHLENELKSSPHAWNEYKGKIIDFSGFNQFVKSNLASNLNSNRYHKNNIN